MNLTDLDLNWNPHWILIGQTPVLADLMTWARWFNDPSNRRVALTQLPWCRVSTMFLGIDHAFFGGPPLLFESMTFWDGEGGYEQERCSTWMEAEAMHARMVRDASAFRAVVSSLARVARDTFREMRDDFREAVNPSPETEMSRAFESMRDTLEELRNF
jgi:hypothetical protein